MASAVVPSDATARKSGGTLFYLVGPTGPGKNGLLAYARERLLDRHPVVFAHRYVTPPAEAGRGNQVVLPLEEFALRKRHRLFVMEWESHGRLYGIGTEINYWLATGVSVVVKGSRVYLGQALKAYPDLVVIWITAETETAAKRPARDLRQGVSRIIQISSKADLAVEGEKLVSALIGDEDPPAGRSQGSPPFRTGPAAAARESRR